MNRHLLGLALAMLGVVVATPALAQRFSPPGELSPARSGTGRRDSRIYAPGIRFPIRDTPAFANSQVYGHGGGEGPGGGQCDSANYSFPWHDNFCESRGHSMPLCPTSRGHQGQDIRAATCRGGVHPVVAAVDGTITNIGRFSVYLTAADGTRYDYLHISGVRVRRGQRVSCGDVIGMVDNRFYTSGGRPVPTTVHLHFNVKKNMSGLGPVYVPVYSSLVDAYERLERGEACTGGEMIEPEPAGEAACWSRTLGRSVDHMTCVQVDRAACGASSCGTYQCVDGSWQCPVSCETTLMESAGCGTPAVVPRPTPRPVRQCRSSVLGRYVDSGVCVQTTPQERPGEVAACRDGCGVYRCDDGTWNCATDTSTCTESFSNPYCVVTGDECYSATLRRPVSTGECVQVEDAGCGVGECAWYRCGDGAWACADLSTCTTQHGHASCGAVSTDAGVDYDVPHECGSHTNCRQCTNDELCGWCDGVCVSEAAAGSCGEFFGDSAECYDCTVYNDCRGCANNEYCGWCGSSCQNNARAEARGDSCASPINDAASCM